MDVVFNFDPTRIFMRMIFLSFLLIQFAVFGQDKLHNKKPNTLINFSELLERFLKFEEIEKETTDVYIDASTPGYLILVQSGAKSRKIPPEKFELLQMIFKIFGFEYKVADLFENEVLIKTQNGEFWFPIQKSLEGFWKEELKINDYALIYIRAYGSTDEKMADKWLFTINSFSANYYDGLWEEALNSFNNNDSFNGLNCVNKLIELNPKDGRNFSMLGYYYYDKGYPSKIDFLKKADSLFSKAIKLTPKYSYVYYQKALVKIQLSEFSQAWENIEMARKLGEKNIKKEKLAELESKLSYSDYLKIKHQP